jgi:hypothetical protein
MLPHTEMRFGISSPGKWRGNFASEGFSGLLGGAGTLFVCQPQKRVTRFIVQGGRMKIIARIMVMVALAFVSAKAADAVQSIDQFAVKDQAALNCARTIAIRLFPVDGEFKGEKGAPYYQRKFADKLAEKLRTMPRVGKVEVVDGTAVISADILLDGRFKDLTTGSRALRFWIGFGAGKSFCRAEIKGIEPKSGSEVFVLDHARGSAMDIVNDDELLENIDEVIEDVAAGLAAARGVCTASPPTAAQ